MNRLQTIRHEEKNYHDYCYDNYKLFEPGTWLHRPVRTVLNLLSQFEDYERLNVLDLGSGIGRNSIPIAEYMKDGRGGKVVCVDLLESALGKLAEYAAQYEVSAFIDPVLSDIDHYRIEPSAFDLIVAVSTLEHVSTEQILEQKLNEMADGTRKNGINCIVIGSNIQETVSDTGEALDPMFELNLPTEAMMELLDRHYEGWEVQARLVKPLVYEIDRGGRSVRLETDCITYVAKRAGI